MAELVNSFRHTLTTLCRTGLLGQRACTEADYQAWRRVAVSVRATLMQAVDYAGQGDLYSKVSGWLIDWIKPVDEIGAVQHAMASGFARTQADPSRESDVLVFPPSVHFWDGEYNPTGFTYNEVTQSLAAYIEEGYELYKEAAKLGIVDDSKVATDLERAETRPPPKSTPAWVKWVVGIPLVAGTVALAAWTYATVVGAGRRVE